MLRFVFMADMQLGMAATFSGLTEEELAGYAERGMTVRPVPEHEAAEWDERRYEEAVAAVNAIRPDLVVVGGDMTDDPNREDQYEALMRITSELDRDIPLHWVPGNHDIASDTVVPTAASIAEYRAAYGPDYHAFDHGTVRFVALNTTVLDHPERVPDELGAQLEFVSDELDRAAAEHLTPIVVGHHPLFLSDPLEPDSYWNLPRERRDLLLGMLVDAGVPAFFAAHWHRNSVAHHRGLAMVTTGPVGFPLGDDPSGLRIVEVDAGRISHEYRPLPRR